MEPNKTYIIRHKDTKEHLILPSGKASWKKASHAKSAFGNAAWYPSAKTKAGLDKYTRVPKFDEQDVYEIVELKPESEDKLEKSLNLLKEAFERERSISWSLADRIEKFLLENNVEINYED